MKKLLQELKVLFLAFATIGIVNAGYVDEEELFGVDDPDLEDFDLALQGGDLGRIRSRWAIIKRKIGKHTRRKNIHLLESTMTRGQRFLLAKRKELPPSMQKSLKDGNLNFGDAVIYHTSDHASLAGITELVRSNEQVEPGWTNLLDQGVVPKDLAMAVDYVLLLRNDHDENNIWEDRFVSASSSSYFQMADFELVVNGVVKFVAPVRAMDETRIARGNAIPGTTHGGYNLSKPIIIKENDKIQVRYKLPNGETITPNNDNIGLRFELHGSALNSK